MGEFKRPTNSAEYEENFAQIHPLMNDTQAYYESARCLFCYDAPCINACPTGIDIPLFIRQIHTGNVDGAAKTILDANYLGYSCGKVCPTAVLCEGACVYNDQEVKPIEIGRLQAYATESVIRNEKQLFKLPPNNGKKVAIIGAGPAGLSAACELRMYGYEVDIFEAKAKPSGLNLHGVAPYKITNAVALEEVDWLVAQFGFQIHLNHGIKTAEDLARLEREYDAVFIGIGLGNTRSLGLPGESLENSFGAIEFIEALRLYRDHFRVPPRVVVLGGGNTAMDAASESARMGAKKVTLIYRRNKEDMGAYGFEYDLAKGVGVSAIFEASPIEILGQEKVEGIRLIQTEVVDGQLRTIPGSEFTLECDAVIRATGQEKQRNFLSQIEGLDLDEKGRIKVNQAFQTTNPHYFAAGDAMNGGVEVVNAVAEAKLAAQGIHQYISSKNE